MTPENCILFRERNSYPLIVEMDICTILPPSKRYKTIASIIRMIIILTWTSKKQTGLSKLDENISVRNACQYRITEGHQKYYVKKIHQFKIKY